MADHHRVHDVLAHQVLVGKAAGANVYLVAQMYGIGVARATNAVVISTAGSVVTLSIALLLLGVQAR